jgi:hypothetical protein
VNERQTTKGPDVVSGVQILVEALRLELLRGFCLFSERLSLYLIKIYGFKSGSMCRVDGGGGGAQIKVFVGGRV